MQAGLRFIVIGGHAVISHGDQRGTEDADILVDKEDRARWRALVEGLGYRFRHNGGAFLQFTSPDAAWWVRQLFEKHGTPELYERILRLAAP